MHGTMEIDRVRVSEFWDVCFVLTNICWESCVIMFAYAFEWLRIRTLEE